MRIPIKSWCAKVEEQALTQAYNLACHPKTVSHVALMPDCHVGYGMPIGGVIACDNAVIPNAVGVDIGCGMVAVETDRPAEVLKHKSDIRIILDDVKERVPLGEGRCHRSRQTWDGFSEFRESLRGNGPAWLVEERWNHDMQNLGTLGGGNHFIELQAQSSVTDTDSPSRLGAKRAAIWLMVHSGSRNLGYRIAEHYHRIARKICATRGTELPDPHLAFLEADSPEGQDYIRDMTFALAYALENRRRIMAAFSEIVARQLPGIRFIREINIHHNFAALEKYKGKHVWIHRKGATSAKTGEIGIIPGSMGTNSYIVEGRGSTESFNSCSHGAGRVMGRMDACRRLTPEECDRAMGDVVHDRWSTVRGRRGKKQGLLDLSEAPLAYKDIDEVIDAEADLVTPIVRLRPIGVVKG